MCKYCDLTNAIAELIATEFPGIPAPQTEAVTTPNSVGVAKWMVDKLVEATSLVDARKWSQEGETIPEVFPEMIDVTGLELEQIAELIALSVTGDIDIQKTADAWRIKNVAPHIDLSGLDDGQIERVIRCVKNGAEEKFLYALIHKMRERENAEKKERTTH